MWNIMKCEYLFANLYDMYYNEKKDIWGQNCVISNK